MATYYWRGSTGGTASCYAWNVTGNWQVLSQPNPYSPTKYLVNATTVPSGGDDVYIGGFLTGGTALSPLLYGGYSGVGNTGSWISNIGATGVTTATGQLNSLTIGWQTGATAKYPFTHIGGGKNAVWDMTGSDFSTGVVGTQTPGLTPSLLTGTYYDTLTVLANNTYETSSTVPTTPVRTINLNYALGSSAFSSNLFKNVVVKGSRNLSSFYQNDEWENGSASSNSKMVLSGFVNKIVNDARPSDSYWTAGNMDFGNPEIYFLGCTFSEYRGDAYTKMTLDGNSTAALIGIKSWYNYPSGRVPRFNRDITILGEVNASKALQAYGLTGGPTGAGSGTLTVQMDWLRGFDDEYWTDYENFNNPFQLENPSYINLGLSQRWDGFTGTAKIGEIYIEGGRGSINDNNFLPVATSNRPTILVQGNVSVGKAYLSRSEMVAYAPDEGKVSFGILELDDSVLFLSPNADWTFGVTAGATGATAIVGGIFGSRYGSWINLGEGVPLFNRNVSRKFMNTTYTPGGIYSSSNPSLEPESLRREAL